ncbi:peptidylprolyl isomerase [Novosphingobium sp. H3SJ31-1]|uniref:Parvulin-like PPIase n=2 Tax=Novosphingobium album (ex Liu et al. 2023) TaxID=3031130 RepID=A0ABT5WUJ4_9SPHN|nr:peptidylprolyl isomerase [Novosphingobium album (ex Liu et al. 2023)]
MGRNLAVSLASIAPGPLLRRTLRDPLVPFLLAGFLLFGGYFALEAGRREPIRFTPEAEAAMVEEFETLTGRKANAADRARMKDEYLTRELLFRDALDRNLHLTSPEAREMLIEKERYLIAGAPPEPSDEDLVNFYAENIKRYWGEPRTSFSQVFRSQKPDDAGALLAALNAGRAIPSDDFWLGHSFPGYGDSMVRGIFGQGFVDALKSAPPGRWIGPIASSRGWHFVRAASREPAALMPYPAVRDQVRQDFMIAHTRTAIDAAVARLKEKYDVVED